MGGVIGGSRCVIGSHEVQTRDAKQSLIKWLLFSMPKGRVERSLCCEPQPWVPLEGWGDGVTSFCHCSLPEMPFLLCPSQSHTAVFGQY